MSVHRQIRRTYRALRVSRCVVWFTMLIAVAEVTPTCAQEFEPRAYSASPIGANFLVASFGRSSGGVFVDPSLPVTDVHATVETALVGVGRTFPLFTRTALVVALVPYAWGTAAGKVQEVAREITRSGLSDARFKLTMNLVGGRARTPGEFAKARRSTIVGASLSLAAATGQYHSNRLINLGTNRWAFKPEVGISHPAGRWWLDGYTGVWFFTANDRFFPGTITRTQGPIFTAQAHASYTMRPRLWVAFDATWYRGGTTATDGVAKLDRQSNARVGATISMPVGRFQSVKVGYSSGASTRVGADFNTIAVTWQATWFDRQGPRRP